MSQWMLRKRNWRLAAVSCAIAASAFGQEVDVLKTAHEVGKELSEWKYGDDESKKQVDEYHFVLKVVERLEPKLKEEVKKRILMSDLKDTQTAHDEGGIVTKGDKRTKGVVQAMVDAGLGREVKFDDAKPGDIVLYWINTKAHEDNAKEEKSAKDNEDDKSGNAKDEKSKEDKAGDKGKDSTDHRKKIGEKSESAGSDEHKENWECRCGVIEKIELNRKNEPKAWLYGAFRVTHGVGTMPKNGVRLVEADDRRVYVVRFGKSARP